MRLAREMFHMRKSIPFVGISYPSVISKWTPNNQLLIDRPNESKRTNFLNNSIGSFSSKATATKSSTSSVSNLIWVDMEMTGLNPEKDTILEMACLITDEDCNIIAEGPNLIIHQPIEKLNAMGEWCLDQHTKSGLFKASLESNHSLEQAEDEMLKFVQRFTPKGKCPLAGNTVYMDKIFLLKYMPRFCEHLHYRILDVTSIKILAKNWYNLDPPQKKFEHRALGDIKESINELTYYQKNIFKPMERKMDKTSLK